MKKLYQLIVVGREGMYTYGDKAASPALARLAVGNLLRRATDRLGITECEDLGQTWTDAAGYRHQRHSDPVLIEAEDHPGAWKIGV